jgi:nucleoside phosphorylase
MAGRAASTFDLSRSTVDDGYARRHMGLANHEDVDMESSQDSDTYSDSIDSSSSLHGSSRSESTGVTSVSGSTSEVRKKCPTSQPRIVGSQTQRSSGADYCIDPRLTSFGSTPPIGHMTLDDGHWSDKKAIVSVEATCQESHGPFQTPQLPDLGQQFPMNDFDIALNDYPATLLDPSPGPWMWLRTWVATNPDRLPTPRELESLKTLSGLLEREIVSWLNQHIFIGTNLESEPEIANSEEIPRQRRTKQYRPKCRRSQRRFRYIAETRDETRVLECTHGCGQSFDVTGQWTRHERYNIEEWKCHECKFVSPRKDKLLKHLRQHHNFRVLIKKSHCRQLLQPAVRPCGFCLRQFDNWSEWLNHVAAHFQGRIAGGPWTMARWKKVVDESFDSGDGDDDDDDDDDDEEDDQGHDDEEESSPDYDSSTADNRGNSSAKGKGGSCGGGSKGSSRASNTSRSGSAGNHKSRSCKNASGEPLHHGFNYPIPESDEGCPFKFPDEDGSCHENGLLQHTKSTAVAGELRRRVKELSAPSKAGVAGTDVPPPPQQQQSQIERRQQPSTKLMHSDYTVGWICALATELAAARAMLDERHDSLPQDRRDNNNYTLGRIGPHHVAIACLSDGVMGVTSAARVAEQMLWTFTSLRFGLMVGIGGGVPGGQDDIRLGDVVVSRPEGSFGGVIQYDYGKTVQRGRFEKIGSLNRPPDVLLKALASVKAAHMMEGPMFPRFLSEMGDKFPRLRPASAPPASSADRLFKADYDHVEGEMTCAKCRADQEVIRRGREESGPIVHYGLIASGNQVMKHGKTRERLRRELNILCFEMEAAGLIDSFPCLVIRGICDYADTHKNKEWQLHAAAAAAAYAKELLNTIPGSQIEATEAATTSVSARHAPKAEGLSELGEESEDGRQHIVSEAADQSRRQVEDVQAPSMVKESREEVLVGFVEQGVQDGMLA